MYSIFARDGEYPDAYREVDKPREAGQGRGVCLVKLGSLVEDIVLNPVCADYPQSLRALQ
jgi:hypothetical protein